MTKKYPVLSENYRILFEHTDNNWAASSPDVPGCVVTGASQEEVRIRFLAVAGAYFNELREGKGHSKPFNTPSYRKTHNS